MSDPADPAPGREYKGTLNLPRTDFPMKGNLALLEPRLLQWWEERGIYQKILKHNGARSRFVLHDGPPYANGHLHAGHALNKILKDIVVKFRNMSGRRCEFIPGWDCHGLPIEQAVEKRLKEQKIDKRTLSRDAFLEKCREYALEFIGIQREEFKRMGVLGQWSEPYQTLSFAYEAQEIRELANFARRDSIYRQKKPVYWCLYDQTALAEAEVEYEDHTSPSIYVSFPAVTNLSSRWPKLAGKRVGFAVWTTTPWTLPANLAIAVHPAFEYLFYDLGPWVLCVAKDLLPQVLAKLAPDQLAAREVTLPGGSPPLSAVALADPTRILAYARGKELEGLEYQHVFYERISKIILGEHVTLEQGTGLVHTAPGHGIEDYEVGLANGLEVYNPVNNDGRFDETVGPLLAGKKVFEANPVIIELLAQKGHLLNDKSEVIRHSYPHCWRCHNPVIFRATHQWFISLEKNELRKKALAEIEQVQWIPKWGGERIRGMVENRPDWCISRQRRWGVPIPMAFCEGCSAAVISPELMDSVAAAVEKEGAGVWYRTPLEQFLPPGFKCSQCSGSRFQPETDILDVWFDSACSFTIYPENRRGLGLPIDLYLEGSDQHRGWFHSTMLVGVGTRGQSPYRGCLTHGFVVDGEGKKMSKSQGNTVAPEKLIKQYGAEVLRLWVASSDYRDDVRLSEQILKGLVEGYRKIRNTIRYALSNLFDFEPDRDGVLPANLQPLDRWAQSRLAELIQKVVRAYENYEFHLVYHAVVDFCAMDLSALYFDIIKDRLYTWKATGTPRRSAQTVLYEIVRALLSLLAPVMSFTTEEAWQLLPGSKPESVFLDGFPAAAKIAVDVDEVNRYEFLFAVRAEVQKLLEAARREKLIGSSLEARLVLSASGRAEELLRKNAAELPALFIVSQVELADAPSPQSQPLTITSPLGSLPIHAEVRSAMGRKCPRCWTYAEEVGRDGEVCAKCTSALG
jgi:isoleucyl-tRNA synthetase